MAALAHGKPDEAQFTEAERYYKFLKLKVDEDVKWFLSFVRLRCFIPETPVRPYGIVLQQQARSTATPPKVLSSVLSHLFDDLPSFLDVRLLLVNTALELDFRPGTLIVSERCYIPVLARQFRGMVVVEGESSMVPVEVLDRLVKAEVDS